MNTTNNELVLYHKFNVTRTDGTDAPGGKHHGDQYLVLNATTDRHAIPALRAYAESCAAEYPALAADLRKLARPADCFVNVPDITLPSGIVVPAFRVGQYLSSRDSECKVSINAIDTPWVRINFSESKSACAEIGGALITETQSLAIAHDICGQDINWTGGRVGVGKVYQGIHKGNVSSAQPGTYESDDTDERRWHQLSNGERIYDFAGNCFSWVSDDVQGDENGLTTIIKSDSPSLTTAPYPSMQNGMGWRPDGERNWSGRALVRGGCWRSGGGAGVFDLNFDYPGVRYDIFGFRCTKKVAA